VVGSLLGASIPRDRDAVLVFGGGLPFYGRATLLARLAVYYRTKAAIEGRAAMREAA
jgi:hypothetical protein